MTVEYLPDGGAMVTFGDELVWTPLDVFTWVAFGERRGGADYLFPCTEWSQDWIHWPPQNLAQAFKEVWSGVPWQPSPGSYEAGWADNDREWARRVIGQTGTSARELAWVLDADIERFRRNEAHYQNAKSKVMAAIRDGRLPVRARKAHGSARPNHDAAPELLDHRWFAHDEAREVNEGAWVDGSGDYKGPWWDQVRFDADKVQAIWPAPPSRASIASLPQPFPAADRIAPWLAVCWQAFGTLDAPPHIAHHRSFDCGDGRFPDEGETRYAARQAEHRRFDAAERELLDLLASGHVKAKGKPPPFKPGSHKDIPADTFLELALAFVPGSELIERLCFMDRLFPGGSGPSAPLYQDVLIEAAGLRQAWDIAPAIQPAAPPAEATPPAPSKRKHTGLDFRLADAPLVKEMRRLFEAGEARSATDAARAVFGQATGRGKPDSKVARLVKLYWETYSAV